MLTPQKTRVQINALIQMSYTFASGKLQRHRLAFFPAPHIEEFQTVPEVYDEDLPRRRGAFEESILPSERGIVHVTVPA